jgi:hypothetical protein
MDGWVGMAVMIGAFDTHRTGRQHLLYRTCRTARSAFPSSIIYVVDNGSTGEDTALAKRIAERFDGIRYRHVGAGDDGNRSAGRLANEKLRVLAEEQQTPSGRTLDAVVLSDDDAWWYPGAERKLEAVWRSVRDTIDVAGGPVNLALVGGYLEPVWHWNEPDCVHLFQGPTDPEIARVLIRPNAPGVALSFLLDGRVHGPGAWFQNWLSGGPRPFKDQMGFDAAACRRLIDEGMLIGQMDLCDHTGWGMSSWSNKAIERALPLDRARWGMESR